MAFWTSCNVKAGLAVLKDNFVFAMGVHSCGLPVQSVNVLDLSSELPCWKSCVVMLLKISKLAVAVINNYLYAVSLFKYNLHLFCYFYYI